MVGDKGTKGRTYRQRGGPTLNPGKDVLAGIAAHTAQEVFQDAALVERVKAHCRTYEDQLMDRQLLASPDYQADAYQIGLVGTLVIVGIGGFKLLIAWARGHSNVGFLIFMGIVALGILWSICSPRLTAKGKEYLHDLELAFEPWKDHASQATQSQLLLMAGVFGMTVLSGTTYDYLREMSPICTRTPSTTATIRAIS